MSLRSPLDHENDGSLGYEFLRSSFPRRVCPGLDPGRESRFVSVELAWIPAGVYPEQCRRAGMTESNLADCR